MNLENDKDYKEVMMKYNFAKRKIETELEILIEEYKFKNGYNPVEHTKYRLKSIDSAIKKLERKKIDITVSNIERYVNDMVGVRIVCSFLADVYKIIEIIKSSSHFIIKEENDYIKNPKESGYTSYHMNVLVPINLFMRKEYVEVEIQIRTISMDCWATLDHKLRYKLLKNISVDIDKDLMEISDEMIKMDKKMQELYNVVSGE